MCDALAVYAEKTVDNWIMDFDGEPGCDWYYSKCNNSSGVYTTLCLLAHGIPALLGRD
jgi:hypothetical protein